MVSLRPNAATLLKRPRFRKALAEIGGAADLDTFWRTTVRIVQELVPHHTAFMWCDYFDFAKSSKSTVVFEHPAHRRDPAYWEGRRKHHLTARYLHEHTGLKLYRMSDVVPLEQLHHSEFYRRYMRTESWEYAVTLAFWRNDELRAAIAIYRTAGQGDATREELMELDELHPFLQSALFRLLDHQQAQAMHLCLEDFLQSLPIGLLLLDWNFQPVFINEEGYNLTLVWNRGPAEAKAMNARACFELPAVLRDTCEQLRARWLETMEPGRPPPSILTQRLTHPEVANLRASVMTQTVKAVSHTRPSFMVRLSGVAVQASLPVNPTETQIELLSQLSPSERNIALLVAEGLSNDQIAARLGKETSTVKCQLTSVYRKLEVDGRSRLVAVLNS